MNFAVPADHKGKMIESEKLKKYFGIVRKQESDNDMNHSCSLWNSLQESGKETGLVWFGLVLWHNNHWRLFNTESIFIHINSSISNNSI